MKVRTAAAATAVGLVLAAVSGCGGTTKTDEQTYQITEPIDALVVDARAAAVTCAAIRLRRDNSVSFAC